MRTNVFGYRRYLISHEQNYIIQNENKKKHFA